MRNALARPHITLAFGLILGLAALDALSSWAKGDWLWFMDYWYNWYVQEVWYVISTPNIWGEAAKFYGSLFGSLLIASIIPLTVFGLLFYNLVYKSAFKHWYLNGYEEGVIFAWLKPAGFWFKAYLLAGKNLYKWFGKGEEFVPPKTTDIDFLYSPNWRITMKAFFNPLGVLKRFQGSKEAKVVGKTSTTIYLRGKDSLVAHNTLRRTFSDIDRLEVNYEKGEIDLKGILHSTQSTTGKGIGDALYSNPSVHKKVLDDQGFIIPEPSKDRILALLLRRKT